MACEQNLRTSHWNSTFWNVQLRKCEFSVFLAAAASITLVKGVAPSPPGRLS